jgi:hypothetical protein
MSKFFEKKSASRPKECETTKDGSGWHLNPVDICKVWNSSLYD